MVCRAVSCNNPQPPRAPFHFPNARALWEPPNKSPQAATKPRRLTEDRPPLYSSVFLGTAAYLIFGSWLNYNRYGARGWDALPHADTIRDVPYLLKEWTRRVINTLQGSGSRGGYSAV